MSADTRRSLPCRETKRRLGRFVLVASCKNLPCCAWLVIGLIVPGLAATALLAQAQSAGDAAAQSLELPQLVSYYPLATNAENEAGDTNHGVAVGGAFFDGEAVVLNGEGSFVNFGSPLSVTGSVSLSIWLKPGADDRLMRVLGRFQADRDRDICLFLNQGRISLFLSDDGTAREGSALLSTTIHPAVTTDAWQHVAATWDAGTSEIRLYAGGIPLAATNLQSSDIHLLHSGAAPLTLGAYDIPQDLENALLVNPFQGSVCQFALFRGVLSPSEVQEFHDLGRVGNLMPRLSDYLPRLSRAGAAEAADALTGEASAAARGIAEIPAAQNPNATPGILYVDGHTGDDEFDGAQPLVVDRAPKRGPKKTMNGALRAANSGDTVYVAGGEYREEVLNSKVTMIAVGQVVLK